MQNCICEGCCVVCDFLNINYLRFLNSIFDFYKITKP